MELICPKVRGRIVCAALSMLPHHLAVLILLFLAQKTFAAVLTNTINVYFPIQHGNTLPASENGVVSVIGEANGVTTYILNEPQSPELTATFIEGPNVAVVIASANPTFIASYSCDVQGPQAVCLEANINPENGQIVSRLSTDVVDSIALLEVASQAAPPPPPTTPPPSPQPTPTAGSNGGGDGGNGGNPSPPSNPGGNSATPTSQTTNSSPNTGTPATSASSTSAGAGESHSGSSLPIPALPSTPGDTGDSESNTHDQGILPASSSGGGSNACDIITSLCISVVVAMASMCISRL